MCGGGQEEERSAYNELEKGGHYKRRWKRERNRKGAGDGIRGGGVGGGYES